MLQRKILSAFGPLKKWRRTHQVLKETGDRGGRVTPVSGIGEVRMGKGKSKRRRARKTNGFQMR